MPPACNPGVILALASALGYCTHSIGVRFFVGEATVWGVLFFRGCLGVAVVAVMAHRLQKTLWGRNKPLLAGIGLSGFLSSACTIIAISRIPLYQALVILYLYPALALLLAAPLNREPITPRNCLLIALALAGCALLLWPDEAAGLDLESGHLIGFTGSFLYGLAAVLTRRLGVGNSGLEPMFYTSLNAVLLVIPLAYLFGSGLDLNTAGGLWVGLGLGVLGAMAQLMLYAALRWLPAYRVGVIGTLEVLGAALASWLLFSDPMSPRALFGGALIILVILILNRSPSPETGGGPAAFKRD